MPTDLQTAAPLTERRRYFSSTDVSLTAIIALFAVLLACFGTAQLSLTDAQDADTAGPVTVLVGP